MIDGPSKTDETMAGDTISVSWGFEGIKMSTLSTLGFLETVHNTP